MKVTQHDVLVIGGGPAGSTAAAIAARAGLSVLLLEAGEHPRPHVGESLLPGIIPILSEMDALRDVEDAGFWKKTGSTQWNWGLTPKWDLWFHDTDAYDHAWLVDRARFDAILFDAAGRSGADVRQRAVARKLLWDGDRLLGATWKERGNGDVREARARLTIDASGQAALIAKELGLGDVIEGLRHRATWAHFEGARHLAAPRENQALFSAGRDHWLWCFPLSETVTSIGAVWLEGSAPRSLEDAIASQPEVADLLGPDLRRIGRPRLERDWSYRVERVAGPGWMVAGDASGFVDPILSTGVFLSMHAGWHAAKTASSIVDGGREEESALDEYAEHHRSMFDDMLRMVRFYYQQNLHVDDYFWESKRILMRPETELRPQRSFMILTSGLIGNLPFDEASQRAEERRSHMAETGQDVAVTVPDGLGFVCLHLVHQRAGEEASLWFLIEPHDPAAPALFRTRTWDLNCMAPRYDNDPISEPSVAPHLRALADCIRKHDDGSTRTLTEFWQQVRDPLSKVVRSLDPGIRLVRAFGE